MSSYRRILLKLSGEMLAGPDGSGLHEPAIDELADQIEAAHLTGVQIAVVLGAGNLCRGAGPNPSGLNITRRRLDAMGMLATGMNAVALHDRLDRRGIPAIHMASASTQGVATAFCADRAITALEQGAVVVFSGGTGLPFFSTDTAAVVRALQVDADALLKGTQVDGIYNKDPQRHTDASRYETITPADALSRGLRFMDPAAIALCGQHNLPVVVYNAHKRGNLVEVLSGTLVCSSMCNR